MGSYKPGDIITIKGTEFAVLDVEKGAANGKDKLFVLLKEPFGSTPFSTDGNDYTESKLLDEVGRWYSEFVSGLNKELIFQREIILLTVDGRANYGIVYRLAAPLTFDEWRKYSRYIPDCEKSYWLATGDGATGRYGVDAALFVFPNGAWGSGSCSNAYAVRPALVVSEELIDTPKLDGLCKYSTMELIQELAERARKNE
jgi:hypothetical protein|nr:MAG TPA: hypothetical protein [Caudoviricetes sp.]